MPAWLVNDPGAITPEIINQEPNLEVRRCMIERIGAQTYLAASHAQCIHRDDTGALWQQILGSRDQHVDTVHFVEVVNGTREPDGSNKRYHLQVPPWVRTAREAVAWTYGLSEKDYQPIVRT